MSQGLHPESPSKMSKKLVAMPICSAPFDHGMRLAWELDSVFPAEMEGTKISNGAVAQGAFCLQMGVAAELSGLGAPSVGC